ncbi:hypothetical protein V2O64_21485 [Verrucomicrobiaceae bacterium 227]
MNPDEAHARFVLGKLNSDAIVDLANAWIDGGTYSDSLGELCTISGPIMSEVGPLFVSTMKELGRSTPSRREAAEVVIESSLRRISDGCAEPLKEAEFLYWNVHHELVDDFPDKDYLGDNLGLQYVFCWLREIWDCRDGSMILYHTDLPREQAEVKFFEQLRESASDWLRNTQSGRR